MDVSIPYRFNETCVDTERIRVSMEFQFLIGSMRHNPCCQHGNAIASFNSL